MTADVIIAKLEARQSAMAEDVAEVKSAIKSIAETLNQLRSVEDHLDRHGEGIARSNSRMDLLEAVVKDEVKGHEKRIQAIEIAIARNQWIERAVTAVVIAVIVTWAKGGL